MNYLWLFLEFLKIGVVSFGGGYGMIPIVKETVLSHNWISENNFYDFIGVCESTPGPIAVNMATYIGTTVAGPLGGAIATISVVLPAFVIILIISFFMTKFLKNKYVKNALNGIQPIVIGMIVSAGLLVLFNVCFGSISSINISYPAIGIFGLLILICVSYKMATKKNLSVIPLILIGAALGLLYGVSLIA